MYKGGSRIELPALEISKAWVYAVMPPAWLFLILAALGGMIRDLIGILDPDAARLREDAVESAIAGGTEK
jgi:TRAP-type C4-dicarboxylate transport system permease small subunit